MHLREIFAPYGTITRAHVPVNPHTGIPKGFAFVEYEAEEQAKAAVKHMDGGQIDGSVVKVEAVEPPKPRRGLAPRYHQGRPRSISPLNR